MESSLTAWESFYVIVGSSAGALTGLQFVVIALIAESRLPATSGTIATFGTPTIVHFSVVLLISAILSAPWPSHSGVAWLLGASGLWGVAYTALTFIRARRVTDYKPVLEDWVWHVTIPFLAYALILVAAFTLGSFTVPALFMVGTTTLLLLFTGIHNAWDTVTFIVVERFGREKKSGGD